MAFQDADRFGYELRLPFRGTEYTIQSPPYDVGMFLTESYLTSQQVRALTEADKPIPAELADRLARFTVADDGLDEFYRQLFGDTLDQFKADNVPLPVIRLAVVAVTLWLAVDQEAAEAYWNAGGRTPDPTRRPQDRRAPARKAAAAKKTTGNRSRRT